MVANNPAGRLYQLIDAGNRVPGAAAKPVRDVWGEVLGVEKHEYSLLLRRIGLVMALPAEIRDLMGGVTLVRAQSLLNELTLIEKALSIRLDTKWEQVRDAITPRAWLALEMIDGALTEQAGQVAPAEDRVSSLLGSVNTLIEDVMSDNLEPELQTFLLEHLRSMRLALEEFRIRGASALREVAEGALGATIIFGNQRPQPTEPKARRAWAKYGLILSTALTVVNLVNGVADLPPGVVKALPAFVEDIADGTGASPEKSAPPRQTGDLADSRPEQ